MLKISLNDCDKCNFDWRRYIEHSLHKDLLHIAYTFHKV